MANIGERNRAALKKLQDLLPMGITVTMSKHGELSYRVRTSKTICGVTQRYTVGSFQNPELAVRALIDFKVTGILQVVLPAAEKCKAELVEIPAEPEILIEDAARKAARDFVPAFKFLQTVPFHELDPERNYNYTDSETGEARTIPKDVIVKFLVWLETDEADSERSDSGTTTELGTSAAAQSDSGSQSDSNADNLQDQGQQQMDADGLRPELPWQS